MTPLDIARRQDADRLAGRTAAADLVSWLQVQGAKAADELRWRCQEFIVNQRVFPQLRMTSWERSKKFYVDSLGFHVDWEHRFEPGFPVFTQLTRDGLSFFLTEHTGDCQVGGAAYFVVDDVDALYREISARGIKPRAAGRHTVADARDERDRP